MGNTKHRPPHSKFKIEEMIELGLCADAQEACDENIEFYDAKINEFLELIRVAQLKKFEKGLI